MTIDTSSQAADSSWNPDWKPIDRCPDCGSVELRPVFDGELMNFLCPLCITCWHVELGYVHKVSSETCPGCQYQLICLEHRQRGC